VTEAAATRDQITPKMVTKPPKNDVKNFHGSLTTAVRAQNDTFKTVNIKWNYFQ